MTAPKKKAAPPPPVDDRSQGTPDRFYVEQKDPNYKYRWCHTHDRVQYEREWQGWEVDPDQPQRTPAGVLPAGQLTASPGGTVGLRRGDLVLMRMPKDTFEQRIAEPKRRAREAQETTADTEAERMNDEARRSLAGLGYRNLPKRLVFNEAAEPGIITRE